MAGDDALQLCGYDCLSEHPGHTLTFMRFSLSVAAQSAWADALIETVEPNGLLRVRLFEDDSAVDLWHHHDLTEQLQPGSPVAFNRMFWLLSGERLRISVRNVFSER